MNIKEMKENMTRMILQFSIPSIIAMVLTSLITVADGFFIGNYVGKEGMAAVNLGLPIVYLFLAAGLMIGVGGIAIAGIKFGAGEIEDCNQVFRQTVVTTVAVMVLLCLLVFFSFDMILQILHAEGLLATYFKEYYRIILLELPVMVINSVFGMFIRGEGNPQFYMKTNIVNVLMNIVLDYVFAGIFGLGVAGIAWASLLSALVSFIWMILFFQKKAKVYRLGWFTFDKNVLRDTVLNGSSEFIGEMSSCISMFAYNFVIMRNIGVDGVTAFTIVGYVCYMFSMVIIGFGQGISPLISFSFGAKEHELSQNLRKRTSLFVLGAGIVTMLFMLLISDGYSGFFVSDSGVKGMVISGMRIFMVSFLFSGINVIASFYFTSIRRAKESAVISSARGLVVLLVCIFTLPAWLGMTGVWLVAPVTEGITLLITVYYLRQNKLKMKQGLVQV